MQGPGGGTGNEVQTENHHIHLTKRAHGVIATPDKFCALSEFPLQEAWATPLKGLNGHGPRKGWQCLNAKTPAALLHFRPFRLETEVMAGE